MSAVALITIVHGRHGHLTQQLAALALSGRTPDQHILVAMNDPAVAALAPDATVVALPATGALPLARARNLGAATALAAGADVLIFLDVDCLPGRDLVGGYARAAAAAQGRLLTGPVTYLAPPLPGGYPLTSLHDLDDPHPARPAPRPGDIVLGGAHELFWSLSFALDASTWHRIGGFREDYVGYGGEDTDFAFTARAAGVELAWIGDARAYHQHHSVQSPPRDHLADIVRNATIFHRRWGEWPMTGWLDAFCREGLVIRDAAGYRLAADR